MKNRLPFPILYEDRDVVVIDKPAGLLATHTWAKEENTAEAWLNDYVRKGQRKSRLHVWLVHRLDRETSGVMMFAKTEEVAEWFRSDWNRLTEKTYLARVEGELADEEGVFESYLRKNQIRVHFSEAGHPVVGDVKYGAHRAPCLCLQSVRLRFCHPHTGRWVEVSAPHRVDLQPQQPAREEGK